MRTAVILLILIFISGASCNEKIFILDVDCDECYTDKPTYADLVIELTVSNKFPAVPVTIYYGDVEDNNIAFADTAVNSPYYFWAPVGRRYSVKAEYRIDDKKIYAVDGTRLKVSSVSDACETSCYIIEDENLDVRLKKYFP